LAEQIEKSIDFYSIEYAMNIFGNYDENIKIIEEAFKVKVLTRDTSIAISGEADDVKKAETIVSKLLDIAKQGESITRQNVLYLVSLTNEKQIEKADEILSDCVCLTAKGKQIKNKTHGQKLYVDAMKKNDIVFGIGPAGTGKTFLAVAMAVTAFRNKEVDRIVLTRPAVEAGEKLGFLPGDLQNKVDPYLRPLYDGLYEIMGADLYMRYLEKGMIEIAPLA
jgi:phosphate starvation-inducible PhoH-like protein